MVSKFHKEISDILSILTIFAMNVGLIQSDIVLWDNMYSDLCDYKTTKTPLAELNALFFDLYKIFLLFLDFLNNIHYTLT